MSGQRFLVVRLPNGTRLRIARRWTDADGDVEDVDVGNAGGRVFTEESLRELIALLEVLRGGD